MYNRDHNLCPNSTSFEVVCIDIKFFKERRLNYGAFMDLVVSIIWIYFKQSFEIQKDKKTYCIILINFKNHQNEKNIGK